MIRKLLLIAAVFTIPISSFCQVLGFSLTNGRKKTQIPVEIINNLIVVPVILNGMLPLKFILDTGVRTTILTEKSFSDILNLHYSRTYSISGPGGEKLVDAFVTNDVSFDLPGIHGEGHAMLVLAEDYLQLRNYLGSDVHGILGYELFSRFIIKIDYEKKLLTIMVPEKSNPGKKYQKMPISIEDTKPYIIAQVVQNNDAEIIGKFLIDTGASHSIMLEQTSNSTIVVPTNSLSSFIGRGLGGVIMGRVGRVKSIAVGASRFNHVVASFPDTNSYIDSLKGSNSSRNGSIGGELLSRFTVIFDFPNEKIYLKKNGSFKNKFYHNLSGLTIRAKGAHLNIYEIAGVRSESVGDKAGLITGDLIVRINGVSVTDLELKNVIGYFNSKPGKKIHLEISRKGQKIKTDFILEDQI
jgi:hypothetical protein